MGLMSLQEEIHTGLLPLSELCHVRIQEGEIAIFKPGSEFSPEAEVSGNLTLNTSLQNCRN